LRYGIFINIKYILNALRFCSCFPHFFGKYVPKCAANETLNDLLLSLSNTARHLAEKRHKHAAPVTDSTNIIRIPISFHVTDLTKLM